MSAARYVKWSLMVALFGVFCLVAVSWSISKGEMSIPIADIPRILLHAEGSMEYTVLSNCSASVMDANKIIKILRNRACTSNNASYLVSVKTTTFT